MNILEPALREATAQSVSVGGDAVVVDLADGRTITVPIAWFPRLAHGTPAERAKWRLIGNGEEIHWPDLDEDISVRSLLTGQRSGESQASLRPVDRGGARGRTSSRAVRTHPEQTRVPAHLFLINFAYTARIEALFRASS